MKRLRSLLLLVIGMLGAGGLQGQLPVSPFNHLSIKDSSADYTFIVSGHFHGASTNASTFPGSSILAGTDTINALKPAFLICLGDLFLDVNKTYIENYQRSFFRKLNTPLFNAVGNHDLSNGNMYEKEFGKTWFSFVHGSEIYIVLNTEADDGRIKGEQLDFFQDAVNRASQPGIRNVFIFSHRPVWAERLPKYASLFKENTRTAIGENNFTEELLPLLEKISSQKKIYWISGSMGSGPASFFYDQDAETNITYMQSAIRDLPHDAVLRVMVKRGIVSFQTIPLAGQKVDAVETYGLKFWSSGTPAEKKFNFRLLPYLTMQMLLHRYFWIGLSAGVFLLLLFIFLRAKIRKRK